MPAALWLVIALLAVCVSASAGIRHTAALAAISVAAFAGWRAWQLRPRHLARSRYFIYRTDHWLLSHDHGADAGGVDGEMITPSGPALVLPWFVCIPFRYTETGESGRLGFGPLWRVDVCLLACPLNCNRETLRRLNGFLRWHSFA